MPCSIVLVSYMMEKDCDRLYARHPHKDRMQRNNHHYEQPTGILGAQSEKSVRKGTVATTPQTIATEGAGEIGATVLDINYIEGVKPAGGVADSAVGAGRIVYPYSKRRKFPRQIGNRSNRAICNAMGHHPGIPRPENHQPYPGETKHQSQDGGNDSRHSRDP
mgnify:CR=1 FL=1